MMSLDRLASDSKTWLARSWPAQDGSDAKLQVFEWETARVTDTVRAEEDDNRLNRNIIDWRQE
jgi:hypothetical protein